MTDAIILYCHGSPWSEAYDPLRRSAEQLRLELPGTSVALANLQMKPPFLEDVVDDLAAQGARKVTVIPMFLSAGKHVAEDVPRAVTEVRRLHPQLEIRLTPALGESPALSALLLAIVQEFQSDSSGT